jgi:phospholipid/cholesterol/gamma-HCH transport system permease protein
VVGLLEQTGQFLDFSFRTLGAIPSSIVRRGGTVLRQFERVAWGSVPLVAVAGASIGLVTWMQTRRLLATYGLEERLPSILMVAVTVETGPILASLLVAGRLGAGLAAELGTMSLTEELDAREALGSPPIDSLVAPRVLACLLAVPLLTIIIDGAAFLGALGAELEAGRLSARAFGARALDYVRLSDVIPATLKTAVFGVLVGLVGCWTGVNAGRSAESVGRAATRGVVRSMLAVFLANVLLVPILQFMVRATGWTG